MTTIQWFPGHMAKARRQIEEKLHQVDLVIELLDARLPLSSRNPMIDQLVKRKQRIIVLTKSDLADDQVTQDWKHYFANQSIQALAVDAQSGKGVKQILSISEKLMAPVFQARHRKGIVSQKIRAMVLGIPNVGKSSLINRLARRHVAKTGDRPGVTKGQQWIRISSKLEILDTPGILWPKFEDQQVGLRLAASGAIKEEILPIEEVALFALDYLMRHYPKLLTKRYAIKVSEQTPLAYLDAIGQKHGALGKGGQIDWEKASERLLNDLRSGRLGRISLERPEDVKEAFHA